MTKKSDKLSTNSPAQLFVLGLDESGKPKGARFPASEIDTVSPVVRAMSLAVYQPCSDEVANLGMQLPVGRIYARGKAFIPRIKRDLHDELLAALASCSGKADRPQAEPTAAGLAAQEGSTGVAPPSTDAGAAIQPPLASGLPQNWESIASGNMVLADAGPGEGFWQAIVVGRDNEILTLRYRDYPKVPKFERHVSTVALINPRPA
jgi:hypothetical protein